MEEPRPNVINQLRKFTNIELQCTCCVYSIRNIKNNREYIGSSATLEIRMHNHFSRLIAGVHSNKKLQNEFNIFGEAAFEVFILEKEDSGDLTKMKQLEIQQIEMRQPYYNKNSKIKISGRMNINSTTRNALLLYKDLCIDKIANTLYEVRIYWKKELRETNKQIAYLLKYGRKR